MQTAALSSRSVVVATRSAAQEERRRQILDAAVRAFAQKGYHACRVSDIAEEAGVAYGLVYHYFESKEAVLEAIFRDMWGMMLERDQRDRAGRRSRRASSCGRAAAIVLRTWRDNPDLVRVLVREVTRSGEQMQREVEEIAHRVRGVAADRERGQDAGVFRNDLSPRLAAWIVYGALEEILTGWVMGRLVGEEDDVQEAERAVVVHPLRRSGHPLTIGLRWDPVPGLCVFAASAAFLVVGGWWASAAPAAATPTTWCGGTSAVQVDRKPDLLAGRLVDVVYAHPADGANRFASMVTPIVSDVAAIDAWWRRLDPGRTLRFDLFPFAGCTSTIGALDVADVTLPQPAETFADRPVLSGSCWVCRSRPTAQRTGNGDTSSTGMRRSPTRASAARRARPASRSSTCGRAGSPWGTAT